MRLITWNCQGAFRKKAELVLKFQPDIIVIQECEHPDKFKLSKDLWKPYDQFWYSDNNKKGVGVFSLSNYKLKLLPVFNPQFRYIIPIQVKGNGHSFNLFSVWAMPSKEDYVARYIGQVWRAIHHYEKLLNKPAILIGDFNSNKIWDTKGRIGSHSDVVKKLSEYNIHSSYHKHFNQQQGLEEHPTFYLYRQIDKAYHIDYCFASANFINNITEINIGNHQDWSDYSDHSPLFVEFKI